ncbi:Extracellular matrix-binding ebh, putative [Babesia ovata]|uniref:Extracellular matrix-binding ebh, putative n=1 Tax=Babesia ovata TaxID=189622 RepID=A0A2H6KAV9_9APIC|nr:Extracellular matrix-binding ebh, putative [Babesia ovata]GBE60132.1 Extracellular matrix-binding ebh, putative [Babesia ovata]
MDQGSESKDQVDQKVTAAFKAVVAIDESLKKDLRTVKEEIKKGITEVIERLEVNQLGDKVKGDLESLKGKIEGLKTEVDQPNGESLVKNELDTLRQKKGDLDNNTINKITAAEKDLGNKFAQFIQNPLNGKVTAVDTAIGTLGEQFQLQGKKNIEEVFNKIKGEVEKIKGKPGTSWTNEGGSGLDGIQSKVQSYFSDFSGESTFKKIVKGWLDDTVLQFNGSLRRTLNWGELTGDQSYHSHLATAISSRLNVQYLDEDNGDRSFREAVSKLMLDASSMTSKIKYVHDVCQEFAKVMDKELKKKGNGGSVPDIVNKVKEALKSDSSRYGGGRTEAARKAIEEAAKNCICSCVPHCSIKNPEGCAKCQNPKCIISQVVDSTLSGLSTAARQVSKELNSVFLNIPDDISNGDPSKGSIAAILDTITPIATDLDKALKGATEPQPPGTSGKDESPAKAVDSRLEEVRNEVEQEITKKFTNEVTKDLKAVVKQLPGAVKEFDSKAQDQIKAAAKTAIKEAAGKISDPSGKINLGADLMNEFSTQFSQITNDKTGLQPTLQGLVDTHIGRDKIGVTPFVMVDTFIITAQNFEQYYKHVDQNQLRHRNRKLKGEKDEGSLPGAIGKIKTLGLKELNIIDPKGSIPPDQKITEATFTGPFDTIKSELEGIRKLVGEDSNFMDEGSRVKQFLIVNIMRNNTKPYVLHK